MLNIVAKDPSTPDPTSTTSFTKKTLGFDVEPAVTPPPSSTETTFAKKP